MKTAFQRLHWGALIAFFLSTAVLGLYLLLFGRLPAVMVMIWGVSLGLMAVVLLACITRAAWNRFRAGEWKRQVKRYLLVAAGVFVLLVVLDLFSHKIAWLADGGVALAAGLMGWYERP